MTTEYLCIENQGVAPIDSFTMLGVSTARDDADSIGQFGSGAKHGLLTLLRAGYDKVYVFCGKDKLEFYTKVRVTSLKTYEQVCYTHNGQEFETSMSLGFGELDWTEIEMGLREFVSNALDSCGQEWSKVRLTTFKKPMAVEGCTRVFVELTRDVGKYFNEIDKHFLHVTKRNNMRVLPKDKLDNCRIYRQGVFVKQASIPSICDYNGDAGMKIDEARNMDSYDAARVAANLLTSFSKPGGDYFTEEERQKFDCTKMVLQQLVGVQSSKVLEADFSRYHIYNGVLWAAESLWGGTKKVVCRDTLEAEKVAGKGLEPVLLPTGWANKLIESKGNYEELSYLTSEDVLSKSEKDGITLVDAPKETLEVLDRVWEVMELCDMTFGKRKPEIYTYTVLKEDGGYAKGFCMLPGVDRSKPAGYVAVHTENHVSIRTIAEELLHWTTEKQDYTLDFQDAMMTWIAKLIG